MADTVGYVGQIRGPFGMSEDIVSKLDLPIGYKIRFGVSVDPYDMMPIPDWYFEVNGAHIKMGKTCMYETDEPVIISTFTFPIGAPASTLVDFVIYG